jgi:hypothetical protein
MTPATLQNEIEEAVLKLLALAKELTWNNISLNCKFILSEIHDTEDNFFRQWQITKKENKNKEPLPIRELMPILQQLYDNLYDINLHIYKATKKETIVDIRYFPKSSLGEDYRKKVKAKPPMLHSKVAVPPWRNDNKEKFDINWQHKTLLWQWKTFRGLRKIKRQSG